VNTDVSLVLEQMQDALHDVVCGLYIQQIAGLREDRHGRAPVTLGPRAVGNGVDQGVQGV
jgi:hypothetical protein